MQRVTAGAVIAVSILVACGGNPPEMRSPAPWDGRDTSRTFTVSSEASTYMVRGKLTGKLQLTSNSLVVVVTGGRIMSITEQPRVGVRAMAARQTTKGWMPELYSGIRHFGALHPMEPKEIENSTVFSIELPAGFAPEEYWLAFQFIVRSPSGSAVSTTYACSERNILGPESLSAERAAAMRDSYVDAC